MPNRALTMILAPLLSLGALTLGACGGDDAPRRAEVTWTPRDGLPLYGQHWWWDPVERPCDEDRDCRSGERCRRVRLGTCDGCPRGEDYEICLPEDWDGSRSERAER